ncbi:MAG: zinc-binding dehydrogenase [Capsulimonadaceae bacterium]|nr:zinc-binding dehydrogenase [Capsulimonadaceae bacterium]
MRVASITGPLRSALVDQPMPRIRADFALIKILSAPMCTEYKSFQHGDVSNCLGHEAAGEVVEIAQPGRVKPGDRVVVMPQYPCGVCALCQEGDYIHCEHCVDPKAVCGSETGTATYAEYCIKQDWLLLPIPDDISYDHASMACCGLGPTFGAMEHLSVGPFDTVLIGGLGPVGLGGVINARFRGARVIAVDGNAYRAKLALELGAEIVIDPRDPDALAQIRAHTGERGVDKAVDCTAIPAAQQFAIAATRRRGHVAFVGWGGHIELDNMVPHGLTLHGIWHWNLRHAQKMMHMIRCVDSDLNKLITHTYPMEAVQKAWELQVTGECGKVILHPFDRGGRS